MARVLLSLTIFTLLLCIFSTGGYAMGSNKGWYSIPRHKNAGKFTPWQCAFERDHVPPLPPEADKLFREARTMQKTISQPTSGEEEHIFHLYKKAAEQGHWKAMLNLSNCYLNGKGVQSSVTSADTLYERLMEMGVPAGYYGKYTLTKRGLAVEQDDEEADRLLHKAADLGYPPAQHHLGMYYLYTEHRGRQGLTYLVCSLRQGTAESATEIGDYLAMYENFRMAMEYYWRGVALGNHWSALNISNAFEGGSDDPKFSFGYEFNKDISITFRSYRKQLDKNPGTRMPDLFQKHPIPENKLMTHEQSRAMPSKLKDAFGGRWPDEIFPELAPGYIPPAY